ncbi:hypothetical protein JL722_8717 [Aureococcus anophagefferens]|nr:hypothetical protein JL722_8717 [Aureococcus anophagefferens]
MSSRTSTREYSLSRRVVARARDAALARGRVVFGLGVVVAAFLSAPTFAAWCLAFWNAKPAWRKDEDAAEGGMENDMNAML